MKNSGNPFLKIVVSSFANALLYACIVCSFMCTQVQAQTISVITAQAKMIKPPLTNSYTQVRCTLQDVAGNMWFGTTGAGIYRYDGKSFTNFTEKDGLINKVIYTIIEDNTGNIWAGTEDGVYRYNGKKFSHFPLSGIDNINYNFFQKAPVFNSSLKVIDHPNPIFSIIQDKIGNMWFGTGKYGLCRYNGQGFTHFNYYEGRWRMMPKDSIIADGEYYKQSIQHLFEDTQGNIWFSSMTYGLHKYDGKTITKLVTDKPLKDGVFYMTEDKTGKLWLGTGSNGVYSYDGKTLRNFNEKEGLCTYTTTCMLADKKGNLWIGSTYRDEKGRTQGCISIYNGKTMSVFPVDGLDNTSFWNIFEDRSGNIWLGARNVSLYRYDGRTITDFTEKPAKQ